MIWTAEFIIYLFLFDFFFSFFGFSQMKRNIRFLIPCFQWSWEVLMIY